jgi:hypothetical protein
VSPSSPETEAGKRLVLDGAFTETQARFLAVSVARIEAQARRDALLELRGVVEQTRKRWPHGDDSDVGLFYAEIADAIDHQLGEG